MYSKGYFFKHNSCLHNRHVHYSYYSFNKTVVYLTNIYIKIFTRWLCIFSPFLVTLVHYTMKVLSDSMCECIVIMELYNSFQVILVYFGEAWYVRWFYCEQKYGSYYWMSSSLGGLVVLWTANSSSCLSLIMNPR